MTRYDPVKIACKSVEWTEFMMNLFLVKKYKNAEPLS
jgi:lipid-A-disaccharide synthase-like uncharacterized protein